MKRIWLYSAVGVFLFSTLYFLRTSTFREMVARYKLIHDLTSSIDEKRQEGEQQVAFLMSHRQFHKYLNDSAMASALVAASEKEKNFPALSGLMNAMSALKDPHTMPAFIYISEEGSWDSRYSAVWELGSIGTPEAKGQLKKVSENDPDPRIRLYAVTQLAKLGDLSGSALVVMQVASSDEATRYEAAKDLGDIPTSEAWQSLQAMASNPQNILWGFAVTGLRETALNKIRSPDAKIDFLRTALFTPSPASYWAAQKLYELHTPAAAQLLCDTARLTPQPDTPEYYAQKNAMTNFQALYNENTKESDVAIEEMLQTGVLKPLPTF